MEATEKCKFFQSCTISKIMCCCQKAFESPKLWKSERFGAYYCRVQRKPEARIRGVYLNQPLERTGVSSFRTTEHNYFRRVEEWRVEC